MIRSPNQLKSVPRSVAIATLLALTDHGTTGAVSDQGAALINLHDDNSVLYHEGLLRIEVATTGGKGATPTAVGASDTFTLKYAFTDTKLAAVADAPTILATVASSLVCALPNAVSARATRDLTFTGLPTAGQTVTIDGIVYTFRASAAGFAVAAEPGLGNVIHNQVLIGADATATALNLVYAINQSGGTAGVEYSAGTAHPTVSAADGGAGVVSVFSLAYGTSGNAIAVSETCSNATWAGTPLTGGSAAGQAVFATAAFTHLGRYLYVWYDRTAFAANALIDVTAKLIRL